MILEIFDLLPGAFLELLVELVDCTRVQIAFLSLRVLSEEEVKALLR